MARTPALDALAGPGRSGHRIDPLQRLLPLRPRPRHHLPGGGPARPLRRPEGPRRPRHLLRPGPRHHRRRARSPVAPAGDDQVVRHQLPLPGPRARTRHRSFALAWTKPVDEFSEALALGIATRPVLLGPVSFLLSGQAHRPGLLHPRAPPGRCSPSTPGSSTHWPRPGPAGSSSTSPVLVTDLDARHGDAVRRRLRHPRPDARSSCCATYFGGLGDNLDLATALPVAGLHVDLVRDPAQLPGLLEHLDAGTVLSAGVVDGRNVWRNDLRRTLGLAARRPRSVWATGCGSARPAPCSTSPTTSTVETDLRPALRAWLAFAHQKLDEIAVAGPRPLADGPDAVADALAASDQAAETASPAGRDPDAGPPPHRPASRHATPSAARPIDDAGPSQHQVLPLPPLPTTTIGSFPQTDRDPRAPASAAPRAGLTDDGLPASSAESEIARVDPAQQEPSGSTSSSTASPSATTWSSTSPNGSTASPAPSHGWVQSYGTRYVRPPILYGDVARPAPMTVDWLRYAQSLHRSPVKGMLTGPGDHPAVVLRPRRPAARRDLPADRPGRAATRSSISRRPASASSRSTSRPCARGCRCAERRPGRLPGLGHRMLPAGHRGGGRRAPRSTPTCATPSSATSWTPSSRSTSTSSPSRPPAATWIS